MSSPRSLPLKFATLALALGVLAFSSSADAQVLQFSNRTLYNAASTSNTTVDFTGNLRPLASSFAIGPDTFSGLNGAQVEVIDGTNVGQPGNAVLTVNSA